MFFPLLFQDFESAAIYTGVFHHPSTKLTEEQWFSLTDVLLSCCQGSEGSSHPEILMGILTRNKGRAPWQRALLLFKGAGKQWHSKLPSFSLQGVVKIFPLISLHK